LLLLFQIVITKADNSDMSLDFGMLPEECAKEISLKFRNPGTASIPLKLITVHQVITIVVLLS
jgi:hypothetical protein